MFKDIIKGGIGDTKTPKDFPKDKLLKGINVEMEHTDNRQLAMEIAIDHLTKDPDYYEKKATIEKKHENKLYERENSNKGKKEFDYGYFEYNNIIAPEKNSLFIINLEVFPEYRRKGYSKILLDEIENFAKDYDKIFLESDITKGKDYTNILIKLYGKYGYKKYDMDDSLLVKDIDNNLKESLKRIILSEL